MKNQIKNPRFWTQAAIIAALYTALVFAFPMLSFGPLQARVAEALCILPYFTPAAIPGLTVGCLLSNGIGVAMGTTIPIDMALGTVTTLLAAIVSYALRQYKFLVPAPAVLFNAVTVGWMVRTFYTPEIPLWMSMVYIAGGQFLACYILGIPLILFLDRSKGFHQLLHLESRA